MFIRWVQETRRLTLTCGRDGRENPDECGISTSQHVHTFW